MFSAMWGIAAPGDLEPRWGMHVPPELTGPHLSSIRATPSSGTSDSPNHVAS